MNILDSCLKLYLKINKYYKLTKGFTLIELLLAILISGFVLSGLGVGLVATMSQNKKTDAKSQQKYQLNRALDYISEDIKRSRTASVITTNTTNDTLRLVYYPTESTPINIDYVLDAVSSPWLGPRVLKRRYDGGDWLVLVDGLTENTVTDPFSCPSGNPQVNIKGFQACVEKNTNSASTELYKVNIALYGEVSDFNGTNNNSETLQVSTRTFARSIKPILSLAAPHISVTRSDNNIKVTRTTATGGTGTGYTYDLYRCQDTGSGCIPSTYISNYQSDPPTIYTDTNVISSGQTWCYAVRVTNGTKNQVSDKQCVTYSPLVAPSLGISENPTGTIKLDWTVASGGIPSYSYDIWRCSGTSCTPSLFSANQTLYTIDSTTGNYNYTDAGLSGTYCYKINVRDSDTTPDTIFSDSGTSKCLTLGALTAPSLTLTRSIRDITLNWTNATGGSGGYIYDILRCQDTGSGCTPASFLTSQTSPYTNTSVISSGQTWCYQIKVTSGVQNELSTKQCVTYTPLTAPILTLSETGGTVTLIWTTPTGGSPTYTYNISRCTTGSSCTPTPNYLTNKTSPTTDTGITSGNTWCYQIVTTDSDSASATATKQCVTKTAALVAPILTTSRSGSNVSASWGTATGGLPSYTYNLLRCSGVACTPSSVYKANTTSPLSNDNIDRGYTLCYQVQVVDSQNSTALSNTSCQAR